jgi:hypothetical protein
MNQHKNCAGVATQYLRTMPVSISYASTEGDTEIQVSMSQPFCDKFPEWELSLALDQACQKEARFWHDAVVRLPSAPNQPISMASLYRTTATPKFMAETGFPPDGPALYGITDVEHYQRLF